MLHFIADLTEKQVVTVELIQLKKKNAFDQLPCLDDRGRNFIPGIIV